MKALPETGRQRLERNDRARAETETEARPWRLALMVLFGAYLTWHIWLSSMARSSWRAAQKAAHEVSTT